MCLQALQLCGIISCARCSRGLSRWAISFSRWSVLLQGLMVLSPVPAIPSQNYPAELMPVSFLPPRVPRTKAQVGGRCSSSSGLMVSDDSTGWKMASHRRSRSTSSECAGHSPPLGMSPQRCASFLPSLPYMEVFTFLPVASCPSGPSGYQQLLRHSNSSPLTFHQPVPLSLPLRLYFRGHYIFQTQRAYQEILPPPQKRDGSLSQRAITPRGKLLPQGRR